MLTIILEDYCLGELYSNGFKKLRRFIGIVEDGILKHLPQLSTLFCNGGSLIDLFVFQWIITMFTADFSIEVAFCVIDMLLVFGWRAVY